MSEQTYRDVLSRLEAKDKKPMTTDEVYDALSFLPVSGEAIATYELPGILSQAKTLMQDPNYKKALLGLGLGILGTAAVAPGIGPVARYAKKGIEDFIPYLQPKLAPAGGPDTSKVLMSGDDGDDLFSLPPASGTYEPGQKKVIKGLNQEIYKLTDKSLFDPAKKAGRKLVIVSCSQKKCPDVGDMKAFDRYTGSVFQSLKKQGVPADVDIAILSAKHGLISRDTPIKKYDLKMSSEIGQKFKNDPTQMNRIINTMTGYDDVIVQGGPLYKDVIRAAAGKADINLTEVPPGGGIGTQRSDLVKLIKGEDVGKKVSDQDYIDQLKEMKINPVYSYQYEPLLNKFDQVLIPGLDRFNLRDVLKAGENLKGAEKKRAISDKADEIKFIVNQHLDQAKKDLAYSAKRDASPSNSATRYFQFQVQRAQNQITNSETLMRDLNTIQENILGNSFDKSKTLAQSQNYKGGVFAKIDTPVYHFSINVGGSARKPAFSKFDKSKLGFYDFGPHVASSPKGAQDRYVSQVGGVRDKDGEIILKSDAEAKGATFPLLADLSKPFNNPKTGKPFTEDELINFKVEKISEILNKPFTRDDLLLENDNFSVDTIRDAVNKISFNLAKDGFTHVPYVNAYEDVGELSYEMLIDRPVNSTKVLQGQFAKKDPSAANDPDFMKAEGGVVEMKDKAVNMYRDTQGIEPFIKYMV